MPYTPHPIPYQGSKRNLAEKILAYFPDQVNTLIEPFAGSAAIVIATALEHRAKKFILNDINKPLIDLWDNIINSPNEIASKYEVLWESQLSNPQKFYLETRAKFNKSGRSDCFLYLLARCAKASVRYNSSGEFNQSPDKRRLGTNPQMMRRNILQASLLLKGKTKLVSQNYWDVLKNIKPNDLVYMDPPYQGVCGNRDSRYFAGIDQNKFIEVLGDLNKNNVSYILSYDGRTGEKDFGAKLPSRLNLEHVELCAGRSSQATLLGRNDVTYESLYISPALAKIAKAPIAKVLELA